MLMNENLKKLVNEADAYLDTSGRWVNSAGIYRLYDLIIEKCADIAYNKTHGIDAAKAIRTYFKSDEE